jgi:bacillithiol system protein YtxJ
MKWIVLNNILQLADIKELSKTRPQVIFKHSTRCSISNMAKSRLERNKLPESGDFYFLDLLKHRPLSDQIAEDFAVTHESPQILLIKNTACVYDESHSGIQMDEIAEQIALN